ncbi:MAG: histidinol dehydrogenase [Deltaproteobacteria bacterium]|nr:histidinol dehydrogenase [Deltaproteobacteria bacterium]
MKIYQLESEKEKLLSILNGLRSVRRRKIRQEVLRIKQKVEKERQKGIIELCKKFDGWEKEHPLKLTRTEIKRGAEKVSKEDMKVLEAMVERVIACHRPQRSVKRVIKERGLRIEEDYVPVERLLVYSPGGKASYPSSLIMAAVPAKIAGVKEIYVTTPAPNGNVNPYILGCAKILDIEEVYRIGGAQAIFAFALGIDTIPKVDMIVGPGNAYVEEAKKECFGIVGLDTIAGPSELLVFAENPEFPDLVALDLLSQAEHDEMALFWLFSNSKEYILKVIDYVTLFAEQSQRKKIIEQVLKRNAFFVHYKDEKMAVETVNSIAPEHVQIIGNENLKDRILYAGVIYLGITTPTALGDYFIGTNHILPTGGAGRFVGGLSVETFRRKRVKVFTTMEFLKKYGQHAERMAELEGLFVHKEAIKARKEKKDEIEGWVPKR